MASIADKRVDVFFSFCEDDTTIFTLRRAATARLFIENYCLKKLDKGWSEKDGHGKLSVFVAEHGTMRQRRESIIGLLQTRGGGVFACFLTEKYLNDSSCRRELQIAISYSEGQNVETNPEYLKVMLCCWDSEKESIQNNHWYGNMHLSEISLQIVDPASDELDPALTAWGLAQHIVQVLQRGSRVAGASRKESFANLLEVISKKGPNASILAVHLYHEGPCTSKMDALLQARSSGEISESNVEALHRLLGGGQCIHFVNSYRHKWLHRWAEKMWIELLDEFQENLGGEQVTATALSAADRENANDTNPDGADELVQGIQSGVKIEENEEQLTDAQKLTAKNFDANALCQRRKRFHFGEGIEKDTTQALKFYKQGASRIKQR